MDQLYYMQLQNRAAKYTLTAQSASRVVYTTVNCVWLHMNQFVATYTRMILTNQIPVVTVLQIFVEMILI